MSDPLTLFVLFFLAIATHVPDRSTPGTHFKDCSDCPEMVVIPSGSFQMGSLRDEKERDNFDEQPVVIVSIPSFALGKTELTQRQWRAVMGQDPKFLNHKGCDDCPVEGVSWDEAQEYLRALSSKTGALYRLPTESEWEYACRAAVNTVYCGGDDVGTVAWVDFNSGYNTDRGYNTHESAKKQPNGFGLYDMTGNVDEWTEDCYVGGYASMPLDGQPNLSREGAQECEGWTREGAQECTGRALRGGSWGTPARYARATKRNCYPFSRGRSSYAGFRPARALNFGKIPDADGRRLGPLPRVAD